MKDMQQGITSLLRLMSASWLFIGEGAEAVQPKSDPMEEGEDMEIIFSED